MKINTLTIFISLTFYIVHAQEMEVNRHYLVEFEKFTPPVQDMIQSYEGFPATSFMANDMNNKECFLGDFQGKACVLFFLNAKSAEAVSLIYDLNILQKKYGKDKLAIIGMADESRAKVEVFLKSNPAEFIVIPNTRMLSEAVYGVEMGYPRIFVLDALGIIRCVIPGEYFSADSHAIDLVESTIRQYLP